jgi:thioredoxin 1
MEPTLKGLARHATGLLKVAKVNVEENQALANRFQICLIPVLILWRDGELIGELSGAQVIDQFLKQHGV